MKIDKHITGLLYEHDCVIVPDFGGFVAGYAGAKIHPTQHVFTPPHKNITFNKHLKSNDGLLASRIAGTENKTFAEANSIISSFVSESNSALRRGEKIVIEDLGSLYQDVERNIQFEPDNTVNYLVEAFGMTGIQSLPVKREAIADRVEKEFIDREPIPQERKRRKAGAYVVTAASLVMMALLIWIPLKTNVFKDINYSSLNPFAERMNALYKERSANVSVLSDKNFAAPKLELPVNDTVALTEISFVKEVENKLVVRLHEDLPVVHKRDKTAVANNGLKSVKGLHFHVVTGCFKIESNARNFVAMLKNKNLNAAIIGKNKDGLYVVSCGDFANRESAYQELARVRSTGTSVWMFEQ